MTTNSSPDNSIQSYIPNDLIIPDDPKEANLILTDYLRSVVDALNDKDIGQYNTVELVSGQKWFTPGDANKERYVYRKVVDLGGLNDFTITTPQNTAHGITINANTIVTRIYGTATDPSTKFIPLPYVDMSGGGNNIQLCMDGTNVILEGNFNYSGYTTAYVVVEYIQN